MSEEVNPSTPSLVEMVEKVYISRRMHLLNRYGWMTV